MKSRLFEIVRKIKITLFCLVSFIIIVIFISLLKLFIKSERNLNQNTALNFTNLSEKEFEVAMPTSLVKGCRPTISSSYHEDFPDAFDWRSKGVVSDVINQLYCNACWAISIIGVMESMVAIHQLARGTFHGVTRLSVQEIIDCSYRRGCIVGDPRSALEDMMERNMSVVTEGEYPLTLREEVCKIPDRAHQKVMIKDFKVKCKVTGEEIMSLIYHHGPVLVTVNSSPWIFYNDGVIMRNCPASRPNHVAQIVGYDRSGDIPFYIVKNSWGTAFGIDGYVKVEIGKNLCGIEDYVTSIDVHF